MRSEEHTSELQSHGTISYAVFCLKKKKRRTPKPPLLEAGGNAQPLPAPTGAAISASTAPSLPIAMSFFFNDTATTEIYTVPYTLSLPDALPISGAQVVGAVVGRGCHIGRAAAVGAGDRKSTRLNSSHTEQSRMPSSA